MQLMENYKMNEKMILMDFIINVFAPSWFFLRYIPLRIIISYIWSYINLNGQVACSSWTNTHGAGQGNQDPRSVPAPHLGGARANQASLSTLPPTMGELTVNNWTVYNGRSWCQACRTDINAGTWHNSFTFVFENGSGRYRYYFISS
jgi:hypothetical protein